MHFHNDCKSLFLCCNLQVFVVLVPSKRWSVSYFPIGCSLYAIYFPHLFVLLQPSIHSIITNIIIFLIWHSSVLFVFFLLSFSSNSSWNLSSAAIIFLSDIICFLSYKYCLSPVKIVSDAAAAGGAGRDGSGAAAAAAELGIISSIVYVIGLVRALLLHQNMILWEGFSLSLVAEIEHRRPWLRGIWSIGGGGGQQ